ncbi:MAG: hypothetical protein NVSMB6_27550 [Burkholderiaceae bacterium]
MHRGYGFHASEFDTRSTIQENIIKMPRTCTTALVTCLALIPLTILPIGADAQQYTQAEGARPHIDGFNVDEVRRLDPGTELNFTIYGSPGGTAALRIAGAQRNLALSESEPGRYTGTYTISSRDRISARSTVTGNLRLGNQVVSSVLAESLQLGVGPAPTQPRAPGTDPQITRLEVRPATDLAGGSELPFTMYGTPGGKADIAIDGVRGRFFLDETRKGEYSGTYTVRRSDRITPDTAVVGNLRVGQRTTSARLRQPLVVANAPQQAVQAPQKQKYCSSCGVVEAVNQIDVKGDGGYLGTIGGGLAGALLGSQVGNGNGRTAAEIAAALGGAYAGHEVQTNLRKSSHYEILVRLENGGTQTVSSAVDPGYRIGDKVRITDGQLTRQ